MLAHDAVPNIPGPTWDLARFAFSPDQRFLTLGDHLEDVVQGVGGPDINDPEGYVLPLLTVVQYLEGLTDPGAAHALRTRIDWKYAFHLPLDYVGVAVERLREFRMSATATPAVSEALGRLASSLDRLDPRWWDGTPPLDGPALLLGVHARNSLPLLARTLGVAVAAASLVERNGGRRDPSLLSDAPAWAAGGWAVTGGRWVDGLAMRIARAGFDLLDRVDAGESPLILRSADELRLLAEVWRHHFVRDSSGVRWRFLEACPRSVDEDGRSRGAGARGGAHDGRLSVGSTDVPPRPPGVAPAPWRP